MLVLDTHPTEPFLPFPELRVLDARMIASRLESHESLYIKKNYRTGKLFLMSRLFYHEVHWTAHFEVTPDEAWSIVDAGLAVWYSDLNKEHPR